MIGHLRGKVFLLAKDYCIIDTQGVGYRVFVTSSARSRLQKGQEAELFIYTGVREDAIHLYGFVTQEEYDLFLLLISVSGIGPKGAISILSATTAENLCRAIQNKETAYLTKLPGIGKKSAERMILELKDKVAFVDEGVIESPEESPVGEDMTSEAEAALVSLGYSRGEIGPVLRKIKPQAHVQDVIKLALKELNKFS